jgi:hypothetical protein
MLSAEVVTLETFSAKTVEGSKKRTINSQRIITRSFFAAYTLLYYAGGRTEYRIL